jgi:F-type H+-transporting ATPase subunit a
VHVLALEFPPIGEIVEWKNIVAGLNKPSILYFASTIITLTLFFVAARKRSLVPKGVQNIIESGVEFVRDGIIMQTIGEDGLGWMPYLTSLFFFLLFANLFEIIPPIFFPPTSRMAMPMTLALITWVLYNFMGIKSQGFFGYIKSNLFPPGVPKALYILVTPIEALSNFIVRPFSLMVRLFANELAGHLLLVTFSVLTAALFAKSFLVVIMPLSFAMLCAMFMFELLVAVLQAFIFTILTAVYIGLVVHPEH